MRPRAPIVAEFPEEPEPGIRATWISRDTLHTIRMIPHTMRQALSLTLIAILALFTGSCGRDGGSDGAPVFREAADIMKDASFIDLDGNKVTLDDFAGQFVVVDFWETWCGPCLQVFPAMQQLSDEFPGEFTMLAVTVGMTDSIEDARAFREERDYTFQFLFDENKVFEQFEIGSIPFKVYIGPDGEVIKAELGSRGRQGDYNTAKKMFLEATGRESGLSGEQEDGRTEKAP